MKLLEIQLQKWWYLYLSFVTSAKHFVGCLRVFDKEFDITFGQVDLTVSDSPNILEIKQSLNVRAPEIIFLHHSNVKKMNGKMSPDVIIEWIEEQIELSNKLDNLGGWSVIPKISSLLVVQFVPTPEDRKLSIRDPSPLAKNCELEAFFEHMSKLFGANWWINLPQDGKIFMFREEHFKYMKPAPSTINGRFQIFWTDKCEDRSIRLYATIFSSHFDLIHLQYRTTFSLFSKGTQTSKLIDGIESFTDLLSVKLRNEMYNLNGMLANMYLSKDQPMKYFVATMRCDQFDSLDKILTETKLATIETLPLNEFLGSQWTILRILERLKYFWNRKSVFPKRIEYRYNGDYMTYSFVCLGVTLIGVHIIFMSGYIFGKLVDGNIVSNDEDEDAHDDVLYPDNFDEYGQKLVTDSLHTLGTNIKKRLHGQLMETDLEDPDVFTFHDNSKQPFKTYINDDIVRDPISTTNRDYPKHDPRKTSIHDGPGDSILDLGIDGGLHFRELTSSSEIVFDGFRRNGNDFN